MSGSHGVFNYSLTASGEVALNRLVGFDGAQATVEGQKVIGVAMTDAADGRVFGVTILGTALVVTGAQIAVGQGLITDTQGRAIPVNPLAVKSGVEAVLSEAADGEILSGGELPEFIFGDALEAASGAGEIIEVLLRR